MPQAKKLQLLREREAARNAKMKAEVDQWFERFDTNGDGKLQRDELRALLTHLIPSRPPTEANLDELIEKATAVETFSMHLPGNKSGDVAYRDTRTTVMRYYEFVKNQNYLDGVFRRYDLDGNGTLDEDELLEFLKAVAPEGCEVDDADVAYVMEVGDTDGDGVISRDEVIPMISKWTQVAFAKAEAAELAAKPLTGWARARQAAAETSKALTPVGQRLLTAVAAARAAQQRQVATASRWRTLERRVLLQRQTETNIEGLASPRTQNTSMLSRVIAAAKAEREKEEAVQAAAKLQEAAIGNDVATFEARESHDAATEKPVEPIWEEVCSCALQSPALAWSAAGG
jgi:calcium-binding protein CML